MYSTVDYGVKDLPLQFCEAAEKAWDSQKVEPAADTALS
jgi:hypothetical protein